ncbi:MAG TPA: hypothetical protein VH247_05825 [Thermoleophilaceae bacterium]|nr:hypothetical protein [Thermoleophilaceae bacterium]
MRGCVLCGVVALLVAAAPAAAAPVTTSGSVVVRWHSADIAESDGWSGQTNPFVTIVIRRTAVKVEKLFS